MGYVYLAEMHESPGLLKIGHAESDPQTHFGQARTGDPQDLRLVHAIAVPNPKEIERQLHSQFVAAHRQGDWFQVSVSEARRAMYAMAGYAASIDAQRELDCFVREAGGAGFELRAYILVMFSLLAGLGVSVAVAALFGYIWWFITDDLAGELFLLLTGMIIGFPAGLSLAGTIGEKIKRTIYASEIAVKSRQIKQEYEENFGIKVFLS